MPSIIDIIIKGQDQSAPAFASAGANLARLTQLGPQAALAIGQVGPQAATGLARVENQAHQTGAAILTLGIAGSTTATRMRSLNVSIINQEQRLDILAQVLRETAAGHDQDSVAVRRAQLAYDSLNRTLVNNRARMQDLRQSGDVSGISVVGVGGGAAGGGLLGPGGLTSAAAGLGLALGAREMAQFGAAAIGAANDLERTQATLRALSGTQARYSEVLALARRNQSLYGGSAVETLEAFRGLIPLANTQNVSLQTLDETTRKLAILSPEQGPQGAAIALREFLTASGAEGARSLTERFELSKAPLQAIIQGTTDATERTRLLNEELARQGITQETLAAQANTTANSYDRLGAAADNAKDAFGRLLAEGLQPYAEGLAGLLMIATGDLSGGIQQLYKGGNLALGYQGPALESRMAAVGYGTQAGTTVVNNYTVQGSLVTERQIAETTRRNMQQTAARNGMSSR